MHFPCIAHTSLPRRHAEVVAHLQERLGVGLGLIGYAGSKALSSKSPWTWQGASLAAAGGVGGMLAGAMIGGLAAAGILALTNNNGDLASIGWALLGLGTGALPKFSPVSRSILRTSPVR